MRSFISLLKLVITSNSYTETKFSTQQNFRSLNHMFIRVKLFSIFVQDFESHRTHQYSNDILMISSMIRTSLCFCSRFKRGSLSSTQCTYVSELTLIKERWLLFILHKLLFSFIRSLAHVFFCSSMPMVYYLSTSISFYYSSSSMA